MLARADELGLPVVALAEHVSFDDVLTEVMTEVLTEQVVRRAGGAVRTDHVHRVLVELVLAGGDLGAVADTLAHQLDVAVLVTSPDGRLLAAAGPPEQLETALSGPWRDTTGRLRTEDSSFALGLHPSDRGTSWAVAEIGAAGLDHGRLAAFSTARDLDDDDLVAVQRSATVCALVVTRELAVAAVEDRYRADYLRDLLHGRAGDDGEVVAHGEALGWDVDRPLVVVVRRAGPARGRGGRTRARPVVPWSSGRRRRWPARCASATPARPSRRCAPRRWRWSACPRTATCGGWCATSSAVVRGVGGGGRKPFGVGVSRVCTGAAGLAAGYEQARTAVRVGRQVHGPSACTHFDDLGVYRLLSLVPDERELQAFAEETLGELAGSGEQAADLRRTLEVLLETSINVAETSRRLHFHYNTLRYRIGKLERMVGPFTTEPTLRLDLALALKVVAMRGLGARVREPLAPVGRSE